MAAEAYTPVLLGGLATCAVAVAVAEDSTPRALGPRSHSHPARLNVASKNAWSAWLELRTAQALVGPALSSSLGVTSIVLCPVRNTFVPGFLTSSFDASSGARILEPGRTPVCR